VMGLSSVPVEAAVSATIPGHVGAEPHVFPASRSGRIEANASDSTCSSQARYKQPSSSYPLVRTLPASIKRAHIEDVHTLHLSKNFETLKTGSLLEIGGHGTRLGTLGEKVGLGSDLCGAQVVSYGSYLCRTTGRRVRN